MNFDSINPRTEIEPEIVDRYLAGEASNEERERVEAWSASSQRHAELLGEMRLVQPGTNDHFIEPDVEAAIKRITANRITSPRKAQLSHAESHADYFGRSLRRWVGYSAAVAVVLAVGVAGYKYIPSLSSATQSVSETKTYSTMAGQRATVTLVDGSQVVLAPATRITVTGRDVHLEGEAVFTVTRHKGDPFTVHANNTVTRVLGTRFGVKAYAGNEPVRIAVADGRVSVASSTLSAGDVALVYGDTSMLTRNANVGSLLAWTDGRLVFQNATAEEILAAASRWYGVSLDTSHLQLGNRRYAVTLDNETRESALRVLSALFSTR